MKIYNEIFLIFLCLGSLLTRSWRLLHEGDVLTIQIVGLVIGVRKQKGFKIVYAVFKNSLSCKLPKSRKVFAQVLCEEAV